MAKGQVAIFITIIIASLVMVMIFGILSPLGVEFTSVMFEEGENILIDANSSIQNIQDETVKASIYASIGEAASTTTQNVEVLSNFYQYAWIIIFIIIGIIGVLATRRLVEFGGGGIV